MEPRVQVPAWPRGVEGPGLLSLDFQGLPSTKGSWQGKAGLGLPLDCSASVCRQAGWEEGRAPKEEQKSQCSK